MHIDGKTNSYTSVSDSIAIASHEAKRIIIAPCTVIALLLPT